MTTASMATTGDSYDGIEELQHRLPRWWLAAFWMTLIFAFGYWTYFHIFEIEPFETEQVRARPPGR